MPQKGQRQSFPSREFTYKSSQLIYHEKVMDPRRYLEVTTNCGVASGGGAGQARWDGGRLGLVPAPTMITGPV